MNAAAIQWTVDPNLIEIGPLTIRWYGLLFASGFLIGYYIMEKIFKKEGIQKEWLDKVLVYTMIGIVLGARLGHVFFYDWDYYSQNPSEIIMIWHGGLASHGAAIGAILALWLYSIRVSKKSLLWILDRVVITAALGGALIRMGNLMNHEIVGKPTELPWGFIFELVDNVPRHPAQLYESLCYFAIFGVLYRAYWKYNAGNKRGFLFGLFLTLIFSVRFVIEFLKENQSAFEADLPINMGQILSIPMVMIGLVFIFLSYKKNTIVVTE